MPPLSASLTAFPARPLPSHPWFLTWMLAGLALAWDASDLDLTTMRWLADSQGFVLRQHWLLDRVLHDGVHDLALGAYLLLLVLLCRPVGLLRKLDPLQRMEVASGTTLVVLVVGLLKRWSLTSCPWDLAEFGGVASYVSHWAWGQADGGPGHCFPGGHASSTLVFLSLALPWLQGNAQDRRLGHTLLRAILLSGLLLGLGQTLRGAHYPSHTLWTAVACWLTAWLNHAVFTRVRHRRLTLLSAA